MTNQLIEFDRSWRMPVVGHSMTLTVNGQNVPAIPVDYSGFGICFKSKQFLDVGTTGSYFLTEDQTGESSHPCSIKVVRVETLKLDEHIVGAVFEL